MPDFKHQDGDGWGKDYLTDDIRERRETGRRDSIDARHQIRKHQQAKTYYELPLWEREALEERANRDRTDY